MSPTLKDLPKDIYKLLDRGVKFTPDPAKLKAMTDGIAHHLTRALDSKETVREIGKIWFSDLGEKCDRKNWYKWKAPVPVTLGEPTLVETLPGSTSFKFLYGNILEEQVLYLAREAGHLVEREQERVEYEHTNGWKLTGRIDAVIDGVLVDVKSTSSYSYRKYTTEGVTPDNDTFGYSAQLSGYDNFMEPTLGGSVERAHFIFVDKQNGHISSVPNNPVPKSDILASIDRIEIVTRALSDTAVPRGYEDIPEGKSGNMKLGIACSYCSYKRLCWPGLKGYAYSTGPVFLTKVERRPNVPELF